MTTIDESAIKRLLEVIGGDTEDLKELIDDFGQVAPELVGNMKDAVAANDTDKLRIAAHSLKSNARDLGALQLGEDSAALEAACSSGEVTDAAASVDNIAASVAHAIEALNQLSLE